MKSKEQKRREAIERLERQPRWNGCQPEPPEWATETVLRRFAEADRLRLAFGLGKRGFP
jgi:hypothetical protein